MPEKSELNNILANLRILTEMEKHMGVDNFFKNNIGPKKDEFSKLAQEVNKCKKCSLYKTRKNTVFGEGSLESEIIFLGEAPGKDEDLSGRPFVGRAGKLLTQMIEAMGYRREDVYIANALKCRPPDNRQPLPEEIEACHDFLEAQIKFLTKAKVICTLGRFAIYSLLNTNEPLHKLRGNIFLYQDVKVIPTYHPAYLLRNPPEKKSAWQDLKKALKIIKES